MPNLSYFRGSPGGTGVPAGFGQATNTGMAAGISKGMDALARGLEKYFENKREQAEEDAYAELLEKLGELPGKTKEVGRKTSDEVMSAAMEGTENLPEYLTKAAAEGHIEPIPGNYKGWTGDNSGFYTPHGPMPVDSSSVGTKQEMVPNPDIEGMLYDAESGEYYPHSVLPSGEFETKTYPDGITEYVSEAFPAPQMIPGPMVPDIPPGVPLDRPMPDFQAPEALMALHARHLTHYLLLNAAYLLQLRPDRRRGRHCMQHTLVKRYRLLLKSQSCVDIRQAIQQFRVRLIAKRIQ